MDLSGEWLVHPGDDELRLAFHEPDFDDRDWQPALVPGHWRTALPDVDGPVLHRTRFEGPAADDATRSWLVCHGVFSVSDVWLDGDYLGDTQGYFVPHEFEIGDLLEDRTEHVLAVEVDHRVSRSGVNKRTIVGVFDDPSEVDPWWNPGGIWRPITIERTGPVRLTTLRARCPDADPRRATLIVTARLDSDAARTVTIRTAIAGVDHEAETPLGAGENQVEWTIEVADPALWWPHSLGDQALHELVVHVDVDGAASDTRRLTTGFRSVRHHRWVLSINGERLFTKGANLAPTRLDLAGVTAEEVDDDLGLAQDAGLDLLRLRAHVGHPALYEAADRRGILLWQDFPLHQGYARGIRKKASSQAEAMVDLLAHHPSIVIWCGHNSPVLDGEPADTTGQRPRFGGARAALSQQAPSWNKTVLDRSVKRAIDNADGTRPVIAHSGVWPHPPQLDGTDTHLWYGWRWGGERELSTLAARIPRAVRFVSEFGAAAVPHSADFCEPERWPDLNWIALAARHAYEPAAFARAVPPEDYPTFAGWRVASQAYQAGVLRRQIEVLRRLKYRPTGGFTLHRLVDPWPSIGTGVVGHDRRPKAALAAVREACRPVIVVADRLPASVRAGEALALDVHVVSDLREPLSGGRVTAELAWPGGQHRWRWTGEIPADECTRVGTISWMVPELDAGRVTLRLGLDGPARATNRYDAMIGPS